MPSGDQRSQRIVYGAPSYTSVFMNDLKVNAESSVALIDTMRVVDRVLREVGMELGLRKCAVAHIKRGKCVNGLEEQRIKRSTEETYQYLGTEHVFESNLASVTEQLMKVYAKRLNQIWSSVSSA